MWVFVPLHAQRVAVKTNALYWCVGSINAGVEIRMSRHWTANIEVEGNPFKIKDYSLRNVAFMPEVRYWLQGRPMARHFIGLMGVVSHYDAQIKDWQHTGAAYAAGLTYGYNFVLSRHWSLELSAGVGLMKMHDCQTPVGKTCSYNANNPYNSKLIPVPLKAAVTFTYIIK